MIKIKPKDSALIDRWEKIVLAVLINHFPDGMTVDDFMSMHTKAPRAIIEHIITNLVNVNVVDKVS